MKAIVLAGGGGTRLWPLSREDFPKQFLNFGTGGSLLQKTVSRLKNAPFIDEVIVATNELHQKLVKEQLGADCPILIEPARRNTAPAIGLAVKTLQEWGASLDEPILVVPSDHLIEPEELFFSVLGQLNPKSQIITFGIRPTKPETGYGYIEVGKKWDDLNFEVNRFVEKPDLKTAEKYILDSHFFWNSGMFLFTAATFWRQLEMHAPEIYVHFQTSSNEVASHFSKMPDLSIDYAIMEKSKDVLVCPLGVSWSDVGSWDSVYDVLEKDANQNVKIGQVVAIDTKNSLIFGGKRIISTIGLDDLLIIETDDALLISKKGESQRVKALLQELKQTSKNL